jgi:hypothetical protein
MLSSAPFVYMDPATNRAYVLYCRAYSNGTRRRMWSYFFARQGKEPKDGLPCPMPDGWEVVPPHRVVTKRKPTRGAKKRKIFAHKSVNIPTLRRLGYHPPKPARRRGLPGRIKYRYLRCGCPSCHCNSFTGRKHGPYKYKKIDGKWTYLGKGKIRRKGKR